MHGCGIKYNTDDPGSMQQAGHFIDDEYVGTSNVCSVAAVQQAAQQAMAAAHLASGLQVCCCHPYVHLKIVLYSLFELYIPSVHVYSFAQEKEGAEGLRLRRHNPPEVRKAPSHASAFRNHSNTHTQSRTLQDAPNRKQL